MTRRGRVVVVGSLNVDLVTHVRRHPGPGETVAGEGLLRAPGGKGANAAVAAAAAGAETVLVGRVGADEVGVRYLAGLRARGVDVTHVRVDAEHPTGHAIVVVDEEGENTIVVVGGANLRLTPVEAAAHLAGADVVLLQLEVPLAAVIAAVRAASAEGATVVLNPSPYQPLPPELLARVDLLVVNEHEQRQLGSHDGAILVTRGSHGALLRLPDGSSHEVAAPRVEVVDTTGAGDVLVGTLCAALAAGEDPRTAAGRAVAAAAGAVTRPGAQGWSLGG